MDGRSSVDPRSFLWLVCNKWGWKNVKRHLVDHVSPEGRTWRGGKTRWRVGGLHWPNGDQRKPQGEGQGRVRCAALYNSVSLSFYFLPLASFKSLLPREVSNRSVLLRGGRERELIQSDNTLSHMRI